MNLLVWECLSVLCALLFLRKLAYSSNQVDVRDLFWKPVATAGQQQQQAEGIPSVQRPGQNDHWSYRTRQRWHSPVSMGCGTERTKWGENGGVAWHSWEKRVTVVVGDEGIWFGASQASFLASTVFPLNTNLHPAHRKPHHHFFPNTSFFWIEK